MIEIQGFRFMPEGIRKKLDRTMHEKKCIEKKEKQW